jgi:hypothetical protein
MTTVDDILDQVHRKAGLTAAEIAVRVYGRCSYQQRINQNCRRLVEAGRLERHGKGGVGDPFTYHPPFKKRRF